MIMSQTSHKAYKKRLVIGLSILVFSMLVLLYLFSNQKNDIKILSISILSHEEIDGFYMVNKNDEVRIKLTYENALHKDIKYLKVNEEIYREEDIIYDLSYLEMEIDDGKRSLEIIYVVKEDDTKIEIKDVRVYLSGIIFLGDRADLEELGYFLIFVRP